jgi:alpha-beta hydrolase superfamily lysophospholipase
MASHPYETETVPGAGGYRLQVRVWRASRPVGTVVMLHGLISHSGWMAPVAEDLATRGITSVCPDRRGSGANPSPRGDAPSGTALLDDLDCIVERFARDAPSLHLAGFCWGAAYAVNYVALRSRPVRSLALLAPSIVPAPSVREQPLITGPSGEATVDPAIPAEAFTQGPAYEQVILPDPLRLRKVSPRLNGILGEFAYMIGAKFTRLSLPTLVVLAEADRVVDNAATERLFVTMQSSRKELRTVPGEHGVQFDAPHEVAAILHDWLTCAPRSPSA